MTRDGKRPPAPQPAGAQNGGVEAQRSGCRLSPLSDTERYLLGRERILGDRLSLSRRPEEAARELVELLGGRTFAHRWAMALLEAAS
jgi:hypothetical protein